MYLVAFLLTYLLVMYRLKHEEYVYPKDMIQDYFVWAILGLLIGARLGYVLFYNFAYYIEHPLEVIFPFDLSNGFKYVGISGMSYHGGAVGVFVASVVFCRKHDIHFWRFADLFSAAIPLGYTFGRIGNFINGELFGRITAVPWGMYFPLDPSQELHHPSQLYEAFFEGIFLFVLLWSIRKKQYFDGFLLSLYLVGYGTVRFFIEFVREPDPQIGLLMGVLTMGQMLCIIMIFMGLSLFFIKRRTGPSVQPGH
jgi:phosphatidylglycerol:prolipoprotein diacylglycerol transferase